MKRSRYRLRAWFSLVAVVTTLAVVTSAQAAATAVGLGVADSFAVLAGAGITNTGPTTINGDIGTFPTTTVTSTGGLTVNGVNHGGDAVTQQAKSDLVVAYNNAAGQGPPTPIVGDLGGQTLTTGVYNSGSSIGLTGALTLDAQGDPNAVWVFQAGSTLTTASGSVVNLINGAQACNVFWQIGSSATLGTGSTFRGTIMALADITVTTGTIIEGRALARDGAVTLDQNTITRPICAAQGGGATTSPGPTASPGANPTTGGSPTPGTTPPGAVPGATTSPGVLPTASPSPGATPTAGPTTDRDRAARRRRRARRARQRAALAARQRAARAARRRAEARGATGDRNFVQARPRPRRPRNDYGFTG